MNRTQDVVAWVGHRIGKPPGWERVVRIASPPERCAAMPDARVVRDGTSFPAQPGSLIGRHVAFFGTYEPELRDAFRSVPHPGFVAVDAGANVGWHILVMARLVGEQGTVLAIELHSSVRAQLVANLRENRIVHVQQRVRGTRARMTEIEVAEGDELAERLAADFSRASQLAR